MKRIQIYPFLLCVIAISFSCATTRKSEKYYQENKVAISELRADLEVWYRHQPFSAGFTDKSFKFYSMQIVTDSLRAIYANDTGKKELWDNIFTFHYDTARLKKMAGKMKQLKCLWIGRSNYYMDDQKVPFTFISFGSALIEKPFVENKFYILIFLDKKIAHRELDNRVKKGKLVPIDDLVYFTIGSNYR
jgi:hypothetical protein